MANLLLLTSVLHALVIKFEVQGKECTVPYQLRATSSNYGDLTAWLGAGDYAGYLEICAPTEPSQWTPVCGEHWTDGEALAACNILGYSNTTTIAITGGTCLAPPGNITTTSVEILQCSGTERSLEECRQSSVVSGCSQWGGVICTSLEICSEEICFNSYCLSVPQELDCICYEECSQPCLNGGRCTYNNTCQCPPHLTGERCEQEVFRDTTSESTIKSCSFDCLNGGTCIDGNCVCTIGYEGLRCETEKGGGGGSFILYIIISLVIIVLIVSIGITVIIVILVLARKSKKKQKLKTGPTLEDTPHNEEEETLSLNLQESFQETISNNSNQQLPQLQVYETVGEDGQLKAELRLYAHPDELEQHKPSNNMDYEETAGLYDIIRNSETTDKLASRDTGDLGFSKSVQLQQYSELNHAFKETRKCFTLASVKKVGNSNYFELSDFKEGCKSSTLPRLQNTFPTSQVYSSLDNIRSNNCQEIERSDVDIYTENESSPPRKCLELHQNKSECQSKSSDSKQKHSGYTTTEDISVLPSYIEDVSIDNASSLATNSAGLAFNSNTDSIPELINKLSQDDLTKIECTNLTGNDHPNFVDKEQSISSRIEEETLEQTEMSKMSTSQYDNCTLNFNPQYCKE